LKYVKIKLVVKKSESFVFYATFIADEYKDLKNKKESYCHRFWGKYW